MPQPVVIDFDNPVEPVNAVLFSGQPVSALVFGDETIWTAPRSAPQDIQIGYFQGERFIITNRVFTPNTTTSTRSLNLRFSANVEGDMEYNIAINGTQMSGTFGPDTDITLVYLDNQSVAQNGFVIPTDTNAVEVNNITITSSMGGVAAEVPLTLVLLTEETETETIGEFNVPVNNIITYTREPVVATIANIFEIGSTHKEVQSYTLTVINDDVPTGRLTHDVIQTRSQGDGTILRVLIQHDYGSGTNRRLSRTIDAQVQLIYTDGTLSEVRDFTFNLNIDTSITRTETLINRTSLQRVMYFISETDARRYTSNDLYVGFHVEAQVRHLLSIGSANNTLSIPSLGIELAVDKRGSEMELEHVTQDFTYTFPAITRDELRTIVPEANAGLPRLVIGLRAELAYQRALTLDQYALLPEAQQGNLEGRVANRDTSVFNTPIARFFPVADRTLYSTTDYTTEYLPRRLHLMFTFNSSTPGLPVLSQLNSYFALGFPDTLEVVASYT